MKVYGYILIIFFFIIIPARVYYLIYKNKTNHKEGFQSFQKYKEGFQSLEDCKKLGYPHDFCMRAPIESYINTKNDSSSIIGRFKPKMFNRF